MCEIDPLLADLVSEVPRNPQSSGFVRLDEDFVLADFGIEGESPSSTLAKDNTTISLERQDLRDGQGRRWIAKRGVWSAPGQ